MAMRKIAVVYHSYRGGSDKLANALVQGISDGGAEASCGMAAWKGKLENKPADRASTSQSPTADSDEEEDSGNRSKGADEDS